MKTTSMDPVAEFLAKGGKIQAVQSGLRTMTEREMYAKSSGPDHVADAMHARSMRDAENQVGLESHHPYFKQ